MAAKLCPLVCARGDGADSALDKQGLQRIRGSGGTLQGFPFVSEQACMVNATRPEASDDRRRRHRQLRRPHVGWTCAASANTGEGAHRLS